MIISLIVEYDCYLSMSKHETSYVSGFTLYLFLFHIAIVAIALIARRCGVAVVSRSMLASKVRGQLCYDILHSNSNDSTITNRRGTLLPLLLGFTYIYDNLDTQSPQQPTLLLLSRSRLEYRVRGRNLLQSEYIARRAVCSIL